MKNHKINWYNQWKQFAPHFQNGLAHINLKSYGGPILKLQPGPGFGDFSHPSTRLVLSLLAHSAKDSYVIDIGCGSGILSLSALLLGAKKVIGIDIEQEAVEHAIQNARLNQIEHSSSFFSTLHEDPFLDQNILICMNMISSEQKIAWDSLPFLHQRCATLFTSGILTLHRESYLQMAQNWGWLLQKEITEEQWSAFQFSQRSFKD